MDASSKIYEMIVRTPGGTTFRSVTDTEVVDAIHAAERLPEGVEVEILEGGKRIGLFTREETISYWTLRN